MHLRSALSTEWQISLLINFYNYKLNAKEELQLSFLRRICIIKPSVQFETDNGVFPKWMEIQWIQRTQTDNLINELGPIKDNISYLCLANAVVGSNIFFLIIIFLSLNSMRTFRKQNYIIFKFTSREECILSLHSVRNITMETAKISSRISLRER